VNDILKKNYDVLVPILQAMVQLESGGMAKYVSSLVNNGQDTSLPPRWPLIKSTSPGSINGLDMQDRDISFAQIAYIVNLLGWAFARQIYGNPDAPPEKPAPSCDLLDKVTDWVVDNSLWPTADLRSKTIDYIYWDIELTVRAMFMGMLTKVPGAGGGTPYSLPPGGG
jgi:hypothetical protein